jgi:hypothetical protein
MPIFNRRRKQIEYSAKALEKRSQPEVIENDVCMNGCVEADDYDEAVCESMSAESISISSWEKGGDMPVIKWDAAFEKHLDQRIVALEKIRANGFSWFPWHVLPALSSKFKAGDKLAFSQGARPSCCAHAASFAWHMSTLINLALGQPMHYQPINPLYTWLASKRGSYRGGQSVSVMADWVNSLGNFPISAVGSDNINAPSNYLQHKATAQAHQSGICFIPKDNLVERVFKACRAGFAMFLGNSTAVSGCTVDKNGRRIAKLSGSWQHATNLSCYDKVGSEEYIFWLNSHGSIYKASDAMGAPYDGNWMTRSITSSFLSTAAKFGQLAIVIPETVPVDYKSLTPIVQAKSPG